jgi:hypothetical protein
MITVGESRMFTILPKSRAAREKAALLSSTQLAHLDMCVTAAFLRPDSYVRIIDRFHSVQQGSVFDFLVIELTELILVLVISPSGKIGITDFYLFENYDSAPLSPQA